MEVLFQIFLCIFVYFNICLILVYLHLYPYLSIDKKDSTCNQFVLHVYLPSGGGKLSDTKPERVRDRLSVDNTRRNFP